MMEKKYTINIARIILLLTAVSVVFPFHIISPIDTRIVVVDWKYVNSYNNDSIFSLNVEVEIINRMILPMKLTHENSCTIRAMIYSDFTEMIDYCVDELEVETYNPGTVSYLDNGIFKISDYNSTVLPDGDYTVYYTSVAIGKAYGAYISVKNGVVDIKYDNYIPIYIPFLIFEAIMYIAIIKIIWIDHKKKSN